MSKTVLEPPGIEGVPPGDMEIRGALRDHLRQLGSLPPEARLLEELQIGRGQVRVDLAVVGSFFHAYEIKSDRDQLARLPVQVEFYGRVVDRATLVVGDRHLDRAIHLLPTWWGVLRVAGGSEDEVRFEAVRPAGQNPELDPLALAELLWRESALQLLDRHGVAKGVRSRSRWEIWERVGRTLDTRVIAAAVREHLRTRTWSPAPA